MMALESQDWDELVKLLGDAEESLTALSPENSEEEMEKSRRSLVAFHTTAAMLGLDGLQKAGLELEMFLTGKVSPESMDSIASLGFAISSVIEQMVTFKNGNGSHEIDLSEILEILGPTEAAAGGYEPPPDPVPEAAESMDETGPESIQAGEPGLDFTHLRELVKNLGGELTVTPDGDSGATFSLAFTGSAESLKKIEELLGTGNPIDSASHGTADEPVMEGVVTRVREFVDAFSSADMTSAQKILLKLADQPCSSSGLYKEIGGLARGLHDSIRGFLNTLDPSLHEIVEDKIPDSGSRLEHILEMTEKAAITTLDHVETMQERLSTETEHISRLRGFLTGLKAIGDSAGKKLDQSAQALDAVETIIGQHRFDLDIIITAQDYQDLSGQIILKITQLLKDIECKLVNVIRTFGVKAETGIQKKHGDELYGPAHAAVENAVHSQDEVDSLLAEFGF